MAVLLHVYSALLPSVLDDYELDLPEVTGVAWPAQVGFYGGGFPSTSNFHFFLCFIGVSESHGFAGGDVEGFGMCPLARPRSCV